MTKTLFTNANIFDGVHDQIFRNAWMLVDNDTGKFIEVGSQETTPTFDRNIDLSGQYVMPGLINCHTHINADDTTFDGGPNANKIETTIRALNNLRSLLKSGVTYIRECGNTYGLDTTLAKLQRAGKLNKVPEIMSSGYAMSMTGGNGDYPHFSFVVDSPDEMRKAVRTNFKNGAQSTKLIVSGGVMSPGDAMDEPQFTSDEIDVAVYETHAKHSIVAAHAEGISGIKNAIRAGVDSIEHGFYVDDDDIQTMKEKHIYLTLTLISAWCVHYYGKDTLPKWEYDKLNNALEDLLNNIHKATLVECALL